MPRTAADLYFAPLQLIDFARFWAGEVASGQYPWIDFDPDERWHQRLYRDRRVDVWLISWLPTQGTQLHDHGGSSGAFTVLQGELSEAVLAGGSSGSATLTEHVRRDTDSVGFGPHYVHDVRNLSDRPAVSVHAYSAPLTSMTFYDLADGRLETLATVPTDDPEPEVDLAPARGNGVRQAS